MAEDRIAPVVYRSADESDFSITKVAFFMADLSLLNNYNKDVGEWTAQSRRQMKMEVLRMVLNIGPGYENLKSGVGKYAGEVSKLSFNFPYYMVFVHKGAGRGYGGNKSGLFTKGDGSKGTTSKTSMGRMGTGRRKPKPWFNPVIEERFPALAELVRNYHAGKVILNIQRVLID